MSIINPGDFPIDPQTVDGTELAARLNRLYGAIFSNNAATARPPSIQAGGIWSRTNAQGVELIFYDGTTDYVIGAVANGAGSFGLTGDKIAPVFSQSTAYRVGDLIWNPASGQFMSPIAPIAAGQPFNPSEWSAATSIIEGLALKQDMGVTTGIATGQFVATRSDVADGVTCYWTRVGDKVYVSGGGMIGYPGYSGNPMSGQLLLPQLPGMSRPFENGDWFIGNARMSSGQTPAVDREMTVVVGTYNLNYTVNEFNNGSFQVYFAYTAR